MKKILLSFIFVLCIANASEAQTNGIGLTADEKEAIETRAKQKIDDFLDYLGTIGSKQVSQTRKAAAIESALDLFIGEGLPYSYEDDYGNTLTHEAVTMQTTNKYGRTYPPKPMTTYLDALKSLPYKKVVIESADKVMVDNLTPTSEGKYKGVAHYYQKFTGVYGDGRVYSDRTEKRLIIYVEKKMIPTITGGETVWVILLGDVSAVETK